MSIMSGTPLEILAMDDHVQRERQAGSAHGGGEFRLPAHARRRGRRCGRCWPVAKSWKLSWTCFSPAWAKACDLALAAQRAGGDQVAVEAVHRSPRRSAPRRSRRAIGSPPEKWTCSTPSAAASRSTRRQSCFAELARGALELDRVGAIGAAQRTAMRQLGQQRQRRVNRSASARHPLSARSCSIAVTSLAISSRGACV